MEKKGSILQRKVSTTLNIYSQYNMNNKSRYITLEQDTYEKPLNLNYTF